MQAFKPPQEREAAMRLRTVRMAEAMRRRAGVEGIDEQIFKAGLERTLAKNLRAERASRELAIAQIEKAKIRNFFEDFKRVKAVETKNQVETEFVKKHTEKLQNKLGACADRVNQRDSLARQIVDKELAERARLVHYFANS